MSRFIEPLGVLASTLLAGFVGLKVVDYIGNEALQLYKTAQYNLRIRELQEEKSVKVRVNSIRAEVKELKTLATKLYKGTFLLIRGPRGVGKTSAIYSALENIKGVITIGPVQPNTDQDQLLDSVCKEITGLNGTYIDNQKAMEILTRMYEDKTKRPLIVLIQASDCPVYKKTAALTAAARILTELFGLIVIIDCCENTCPSTLTDREVVFDIEPMSYEMMRKLPAYENIATEIEKQGNADLVLAVCGGSPLLLSRLSWDIERAKLKGLSTEQVVQNFVMTKIKNARFNIFKVSRLPAGERVLNEFKNKSNSSDVYQDYLNMTDMNVVKRTSANPNIIYSNDMPDVTKVLRLVREMVLVPATGAVALQLRMGIDKNNWSFEEIKKWLNQQDESVKASLLLKESTTCSSYY